MPLHTCRWLLSTLFLGLAPGCALLTAGAGHEGGTATLTEAAGEADSASSKHRRLDVGYTTPPETSVEVEAGASQYQSGSGEPSPAAAKSGSPDIVLGAVVGYGGMGGDKYDGFGQFGLDLGGYASPNLRFDVVGLFSPIQFAGESIAGQSFKNEFELDLDITARYYVTSSNTFVGVYPIVGVSIGTLFWDYNHPVTILEDTGTRQVSTDYINHFSLYGGAGMSVMQIRHVHVGSNLTGGVRFYDDTSSNGFSNTLFPSAGFVLLRFELTYRD